MGMAVKDNQWFTAQHAIPFRDGKSPAFERLMHGYLHSGSVQC